MTKCARASQWATQGLPEHLLEKLVADSPDERQPRLYTDLRQVCRQWRSDASHQVCSSSARAGRSCNVSMHTAKLRALRTARDGAEKLRT